MPRFYFHTETDVRTTDYEGHDCASYLYARREGIATCGQMMRDAPDSFWGSRSWSVSITDADNLILWEIHIDGQPSSAGRLLDPQDAVERR